MEAFGYERIIFGSSPSSSSRAHANVGNWFDIARESLAELGIEQASVDAVFYDNAQKVYGKK
jgi:predicted TIM-barrel fold metal-dependent hydrolase